MSELLDKQLYVQIEILKKYPGVHASPRKVCDENESKKKNDDRIIFCGGRRNL